MKRFTKFKSKKGFTLLETLLATCILVIISSMLMEGFITTMGYSYNTSVYSRSAAYNSKLCIDKLSEWSMYADGIKSYSGGTPTTEDAPYKNVGLYASTDPYGTGHSDELLTFSSLGTVRIAIYEQKDVNDDYTGADNDPLSDGYVIAKKQTGMVQSANNLSKFTSEAVGGNPNAVADNRTVFFYYPTVNGSGDSLGKTHVYIKSDNTYVWGYDDSSAPDGVHVLEDRVNLEPEKPVAGNDQPAEGN